MKNPNRILISEDTDEWQSLFRDLFDGRGYRIEQRQNITTTLEALEKFYFNVAIVDLSLDPRDETRLDGIETMKRIKALGEGTQSIVLTGKGTVQLAVDILREFKVFHFLEKEKFDEDQFFKLIHDASDQAYTRVLSPGCLPPAETIVELIKWDKLSAPLQASGADIQGMFYAVLRACMPVKLAAAAKVTPVFDPDTKTISATVWSKWFGRSLNVCVGKRELSSLPGAEQCIERRDFGKITGCIVTTDGSLLEPDPVIFHQAKGKSVEGSIAGGGEYS